MNLIGNCCISNFLLRKYGYGNMNPFTWVVLDFDSMCYLITNYDKIDWFKIRISRKKHPAFKDKDLYELTINEKLKISYIHYLFDKNCKEPKLDKNGKEVYYYRIWRYIVEKYIERANRMLKNNMDPVFIIEWEAFGYTRNKIKNFLNLDLKYKTVVITNDRDFFNLKKKNLLLIYDEHKKNDVTHDDKSDWYPGNFANKYADQIRDFIESK